MLSFTSIPQALGRASRRSWGAAALSLLTLALSGCGGGGDNDGAFVSTMSTATLAYSRNVTITVNGSGLSNGVTVKVDSGCGEVTEVAGGDSQTRRFQCKVTALGPITMRAFNAKGLELARLQGEVPLPEVTFSITGVGTGVQTVVMQLDPKAAPLSVNNFLDYVNAGFYRSTIFHRVIKDFVVQGGGFTAGPTIKAATQPAIKLESNNGLKNTRGTIAMARTLLPDSATSQFYFNVVDNPSLDYKSDQEPGYAVFGKVITGLDVVDLIAAVPVRVDIASGLTTLPTTNVVIALAQQTK